MPLHLYLQHQYPPMAFLKRKKFSKAPFPASFIIRVSAPPSPAIMPKEVFTPRVFVRMIDGLSICPFEIPVEFEF